MAVEQERPFPHRKITRVSESESFFRMLSPSEPTEGRRSTGLKKYGMGVTMQLGDSQIFYYDYKWRGPLYKQDSTDPRKDKPTVVIEQKTKRFHRKKRAVVEKVTKISPYMNSVIVEGSRKGEQVFLVIEKDGSFELEPVVTQHEDYV